MPAQERSADRPAGEWSAKRAGEAAPEEFVSPAGAMKTATGAGTPPVDPGLVEKYVSGLLDGESARWVAHLQLGCREWHEAVVEAERKKLREQGWAASAAEPEHGSPGDPFQAKVDDFLARSRARFRAVRGAADQSQAPPIDLEMIRAFVEGRLDADATRLVNNYQLRYRGWREAYLRVLMDAVRDSG